jgi:2-methylcitrate synthase
VYRRPTGNDLHYRGYDILEIADVLRIRGDRLSAGLREAAHAPSSRAISEAEGAARPAREPYAALEALPAAAHPMDVLRTGVSVLGCTLPEKDDHNASPARAILPTG